MTEEVPEKVTKRQIDKKAVAVRSAIAIGCFVVVFGGNFLINRYLPEYRFDPIGKFQGRTGVLPDRNAGADTAGSAGPSDYSAARLYEGDLKLRGTVVHQSEQKKDAAYINEKLYEVGDTLPEGLTVTEVRRQQIFLQDKNNQTVYLNLERFNIDNSVVGRNIWSDESDMFHVPQANIDRITASVGGFLSDANTSLTEGTADERAGLKLNYLRRGGVYDTLGFEAGDVLLSVNGYALESDQATLRLYQQLRLSSLLEIELLRTGTVKKLRFFVR